MGTMLLAQIKGTSAIERELNIPLICASNIVPIQDIRDALSRRTAFLEFEFAIKKSNTKLIDFIVQNELPIIIKKFTLAYWDYFHQYSEQEPKDWMPKYFLIKARQMAAENNPIRSFLLHSGYVQILKGTAYKNVGHSVDN